MPVEPGANAEPLEAEQRGAEVVAPDTLDGDLAVGDRGEADEAADLDVIGADRVARAGEGAAALDGVDVGADALDVRAQRVEEAGEVLHVRLGGGVAQDGAALGGHRGHEGVLGAGDAGLVEEDVGADELPWPRARSRRPRAPRRPAARARGSGYPPGGAR